MTDPISESLALALRSGDWPNVERLTRAQLRHFPENEGLLATLAISLQVQGKLDEAIDTYAQLTAAHPKDAVHWSNYAGALRAAGKLQDAERAARAAVGIDARNADALIQLGLILQQRQDYPAARGALLDAFDIDRGSARARIHAARACCLCQDFHGAEDLLRGWQDHLPVGDDALRVELANLLLLLGDASGAQMLLEQVVGRNPDYVEATIFLANVYERMNRLDEMAALLQPLVARGSELPPNTRLEVGHALASLVMRQGDLKGARALLETAGPRSPTDSTHYFDIGEIKDKLGDQSGAMLAFHRAHAIQVEQLRQTEPDYFLPGTAALPANVIDVTGEAYRQWPLLDAPDARESPVFIVGFPRSGTTLLEQMLDAHPGLQSMDENPFFNRLADTLRRHDPRVLQDLGVLRQLDCDELRKRYLLMVSEKIERRWDAQLVDKNPLNMLWLPIIHRLFPAAKFILAIRHPCDVVLSCYMQNFRSSLLIAAGSTLERLAAAYVSAMQRWLTNVAVLQPNVLVSRYEDLVLDFPQQTARIAQFLGLEDATPMLRFDEHARGKAFIATPSYSQVIEPVNRKGMNRWFAYREEFRPLLPILEPMLEHWSYSGSTDAA
jgi:tetratricopeptide (TPR) repeat protein